MLCALVPSSSVTACVSSGWTGLIRSLTPSSSSYRYLTTLGSTATPRDAVPLLTLIKKSPYEFDYGKDKFGGPFTEEVSVEDVKTVLRLLPLVTCMSLGVGTSAMTPSTLLIDNQMTDIVLNVGIRSWLLPLLLIPIHQFLIRPLLGRYTPSMLKSIGIGLLIHLAGYIALEAAGIWGVAVTQDQHRYLSCAALSPTNTIVWPDYYWEWYWKLTPFIFCGVGRATMITVLLPLFY